MKGAKVRRWFAHDDKVDAAGRPVLVCRQKRIPFSKAVPVFIVPATPEAQEGYVEAMARAILTHQDYKPFLPIDATDRKMAHDIARAALLALLGRGKG